MQKHSDIIHAKLNALIQTKTQRSLWLVFLMILGYALRWQYFQGYYYNPDELIHLNIAKGDSLASVWQYWRNETHPPLGHFIRYFWMMLGNAEEISFQRHLSIIFGLGCIPLMYLFGKELYDRRVGILSAIILTYAHHAIMSSAVVRNYTMGSVFILMALIFFLRLYKRGHIKDALLFIGFSVVTTATVYLTALTFFSILSTWCLIDFWQKKYRKSVYVCLLGIPAALVCVGFYVFQMGDITQYSSTVKALNTSYIEESHYGSLALYAISCFFQAIMLLPNALGSYEFYWYALDLTWSSELLVNISLCCTAVLLMFVCSKHLPDKTDSPQKRYLYSLMVLVITLAIAIYIVSPAAIGVPRRWFCFFVPIIPVFAYGCLCIKKRWAVSLLAFPILISFWWNMDALEIVVSNRHQKILLETDISKVLRTENYEIIAPPPTALMVLNKNKNMYGDHLNDLSHTTEKSYIMFNRHPIYTGIFDQNPFSKGMQNSENALAKHIKKLFSTKPVFVFFLSRWHIAGESIFLDILFCHPLLSGAKVLLKEPRNSRVNHTQYYMVALPYQTAYDLFVTQKIACPRKQSLKEKEAIWNSIEVTP